MDGGREIDPLPALADRFERKRRAEGLAFEDVARRAELDLGLTEAILAGREDPGVFAWLKLAGALGLDPAEALDGLEWVPGSGANGGGFHVEPPEEA
ncbi:MAG TPA: helix-turn-helix domain-containing protein [Solirubrobacterales bacterium]|nr:helix-turn-helix domain-containing protein [Solirubrobacterales bacterium]